MFLLRGKNAQRLLKAADDINQRRNIVKRALIDQ